MVQILEENEKEDPLVYKIPVGDEKTCKICKSLYLNNDGSPKIYRLSELIKNGNNNIFGIY